MELKHFAKKKRIFVTFILLFFGLLGVFQVQLGEFKAEVKETEKANKLEKQKPGQFAGYTPYSVYGLHFICMPSPLDFLNNFKIQNGLESSADVGSKLNITEDKKGNNALPDTAGGYLNFVGILLLAGAVLMAVFGFTDFYDENRWKYFCSCNSIKKVFFQVVSVRITVVTSFVLLLVSGTVILAFINGINILDKYYLYFTLAAIFVLNFFLILGTAHGASKDKTTGKSVLVILLIFLLVVVPWAAIKIGRHAALNISSHQTEYDKFDLLMIFERSGIKKFGDVRSGEEFEKLVKGYRDNNLKILENIESKHMEQLEDKAGKYRLFRMLFPSTYFLGSALEFSGKGTKGYFALYKYSRKKKIGFIIYYFQKEYFTKPGSKQVEPYLKGDEAIFILEPGLPDYFLLGSVLLIIYTIAAGVTAYIKVLRRVYVKQKLPAEEDMFIHITQSETNVLFTLEPLVNAKLYNHLSGTEKLKSQVDLVSGAEFESAWNSDFAYLPHPDTLEDIGPRVLHTYLFGKAPKRNSDTWEVMFKFALLHKLIVMDDFLKGMPPDRIRDILLKIEEKQLFCLIISSDYYFTNAIVKDRKNIYCLKTDPLFKLLNKS